MLIEEKIFLLIQDEERVCKGCLFSCRCLAIDQERSGNVGY